MVLSHVIQVIPSFKNSISVAQFIMQAVLEDGDVDNTPDEHVYLNI